MISPVETLINGSKEAKKEMVGFVKSVVGNKKFQFNFEDGQMKYMSTSLFMFILAEEEVVKGGEDIIYDLP